MLLRAIAVAWLAAVTGLSAWVWHYKLTPGVAASAPSDWPAGTQLTHNSKPTLLAFIHPLCQCSQATINELERVQAQMREPVTTYLVMRGTDDVKDSSNYRAAQRLTRTDIVIDNGGDIARAFGVETSGQVLLYSREGVRLFAGGITGARGHEGDNAGKHTLLALLADQRGDSAAAHVFGCEWENAK